MYYMKTNIRIIIGVGSHDFNCFTVVRLFSSYIIYIYIYIYIYTYIYIYIYIDICILGTICIYT